jgi:hypothetical protein
VVVAGGITAAIIFLPSRNGSGSTPAASPSTPAPAPPVSAVKEVRARDVSRADRRAILSALSLFISSSVARHHPERSFGVIHPSLREGFTRAQWSTGNIPVVPYPASGIDFVGFQSFTGKHALIEILLEPTKRSNLVRKTFQADLRLLPHHRWTIASWVPEGVSESQYAANASTESAKVVAEAANPHRLSATWIFVPLGGLLAALILTPAAIFGRQYVSDRRTRAQARRSFP